MAACIRCSRENAEYENTFLVVMKDTSAEGGLAGSSDNSIATETEHLDGAAVFGICSDCHGKSAKATVRTAAVVMSAMGVLLSVGSHLSVLLVLAIGIGGFLAGGGRFPVRALHPGDLPGGAGGRGAEHPGLLSCP